MRAIRNGTHARRMPLLLLNVDEFRQRVARGRIRIVCELACLSYWTVYEWVYRHRTARPAGAQALADAVGVPITRLFYAA
jgi:hypothetical protein